MHRNRALALSVAYVNPSGGACAPAMQVLSKETCFKFNLDEAFDISQVTQLARTQFRTTKDTPKDAAIRSRTPGTKKGST